MVPELLVGKAHRPYVGSEDIYFFHWERGCSQEHFGSWLGISNELPSLSIALEKLYGYQRI